MLEMIRKPKPIERNTLLSALEARVEKHLDVAIHTFQNLTTAGLNQQPVSGGWSVAQCLWHLNSYGDFYLPEIAKALKGSTPNPKTDTFQSGRFGAYFTRMMEPGAGGKMKAMKGHIPPSDFHAPDVVATFIAQQELMLGYLRQARKYDLGAIRLPISISKLIRLKLGDVFQFCIAHDARHLAQAEKVLLED